MFAGGGGGKNYSYATAPLRTFSETCVSKVEPQRAVLSRKISSPFGSPISSAKRWNVDRGTTIRRRQNSICASGMKGLYSRRQRCIPVIHETIKYDAIRYFTLRSEADISQLNLPHETKKIIEWKYENKKNGYAQK